MMYLYSEHDKKRLAKDSSKKEDDPRSEYRRDYARVIHSASFRRLQGKTQIFPPFESDYFRNRLTHSLEVAQIGKGIVKRLNKKYKHEIENAFGKDVAIDEDIVEFAGLAHDIGHPPFGHNGEEALNECMECFGGFEGNAQTLRILTTLEKKEIDGEGNSVGLNLTYRSLAAILKYDKKLSKDNKKGYYESETEIVKKIKENVVGKDYKGKFKTIECQIMDIADDIAYSTYDLEDAFKAGFLTPLGMLETVSEKGDKLANNIAVLFNKKSKAIKLDKDGVKDIIYRLFNPIFEDTEEPKDDDDTQKPKDDKENHIAVYHSSNKLASDDYKRIQFTSILINYFIKAISLKVNKANPCLSTVRLTPDALKDLEVLKQFTYFTIINSPMVKITRYRGFKIVKALFDAFDEEGKGYSLLPKNWQDKYKNAKEERQKKRVICDFIAGMTDRYALEFYGRLHSERPETIFKPLN